MLGVLITALFSIGAIGFGKLLIGRWLDPEDAAARVGISGLAGLASLGLITLLVGLIPGGLKWGVFVVAAAALFGWFNLLKGGLKPKLAAPKGPLALVLLIMVLLAGCSLVSVLAPSSMNEWDTLAYHLAAPKMWLASGHIDFISFIHQSNFPAAVDSLYIWGLQWGGQSGAQAFTFAYGVFGAITVFGLARGWYDERAGWFASLAFVSIPMVVWECGTAYVDVANGLFVALGIMFAARLVQEPTENRNLYLSGIFLGFASASKYTGVQTVIVVGVVLIAYALSKKAASIKSAVLIGVIALAICSPCYIKNIVNTGNPVYPFFYSIFKGKNWDAFGERIYKNQQQTFGVGRELPTDGKTSYTENPLQPARIGGSILGLAYQPGRYVDPAPTMNMGLPYVTLGAIPLIGLFVWALSGRLRRFEGATIAIVFLSLAMWFVLSQQSRYIVGLMIPLCVLAGGAVSRLQVGKLVGGAIVAQAAFTLLIFTKMQQPGEADPQLIQKLRVVLGTTTPEEYEEKHVGFYKPAQELNKIVKGGKVALYEEVFGFFLDVPYFWANPGHTTELGYADMQTSDDLVAAWKRLGITHVYIDIGSNKWAPADATRWLAATGIQTQAKPYTQAEREGFMSNLEIKWKPLFAESIAAGKLKLVNSFGPRLIFEINQ